jgi:hypothetical protein
MALSKIDAANFLDGTLPDTNINNASLDNVTGLPAGVGGKVLQVVTATDSSERATTSTSFVTASNTLTINITPSSTSNKIFLNATGAFGGSVGFMYTTIFRGATDLGYSSEGITQYNNSDGRIIPFAMSILDSPNSTSEQTYQVYFRRYDANATSILAATKKTITAFEIAG